MFLVDSSDVQSGALRHKQTHGRVNGAECELFCDENYLTCCSKKENRSTGYDGVNSSAARRVLPREKTWLISRRLYREHHRYIAKVRITVHAEGITIELLRPMAFAHDDRAKCTI